LNTEKLTNLLSGRVEVHAKTRLIGSVKDFNLIISDGHDFGMHFPIQQSLNRDPVLLGFSSEKHGVDILFKLLLLQLIQTFALLRKSFGCASLQVRSINDLSVDIGQYYPRLIVASTGRGNNRHTG